MQEYLSEAIVLEKESSGDIDARVFLFTRYFGKLAAKIKSAKRVTSKLSGHLEPGYLAKVRLVEKSGLHVADALKISEIGAAPPDLSFLNLLLADSEPDQKLWHLLISQKFGWTDILKILGWDPQEATCAICGKIELAAFGIVAQEFFCASCSRAANQNKLLYI